VIDRVALRLRDIQQAIADIRTLLHGKSLDDLVADRISRAAFERFLEVISEASRHIPEGEKAQHDHVPWRQIADMGNHLRHAYHQVDPGILWDVYAHELDQVDEAVQAMLQTRPSEL
jgi:uncharacterized protein with HEPN domain